MTALRIVASLVEAVSLRLLLEQIRRAAFRTRTRNGLRVQREFAFRIAIARIENAAARSALYDLALAALRALHSGRRRRNARAAADFADVAAIGITGAAVERTVSAALEHHLFAAQLARRLWLGRNVRLQKPRIFRRLAL